MWGSFDDIAGLVAGCDSPALLLDEVEADSFPISSSPSQYPGSASAGSHQQQPCGPSCSPRACVAGGSQIPLAPPPVLLAQPPPCQKQFLQDPGQVAGVSRRHAAAAPAARCIAARQADLEAPIPQRSSALFSSRTPQSLQGPHSQRPSSETVYAPTLSDSHGSQHQVQPVQLTVTIPPAAEAFQTVSLSPDWSESFSFTDAEIEAELPAVVCSSTDNSPVLSAPRSPCRPPTIVLCSANDDNRSLGASKRKREQDDDSAARKQQHSRQQQRHAEHGGGGACQEVAELRAFRQLVEDTFGISMHAHAAAPGAPLTFASAGLQRLLALDAAALRGASLLELAVPEDRGTLAAALGALAAGPPGGPPINVSYTFRHPRTRTLRRLLTTLRRSGGGFIAATNALF